MEIITERFKEGHESTIARLIVNGKLRGYIPEDTDRRLNALMSSATIAGIKIHGRTAIPYSAPGKPYEVGLTVSTKFGGVLWPELLRVPGYQGIRPHGGNYVTQTDGCQMPGETYDQDKLGFFRVWNSQKIFKPLKLEIEKALKKGERVTWEVRATYK